METLNIAVIGDLSSGESNKKKAVVLGESSVGKSLSLFRLTNGKAGQVWEDYVRSDVLGEEGQHFVIKGTSGDTRVLTMFSRVLSNNLLLVIKLRLNLWEGEVRREDLLFFEQLLSMTRSRTDAPILVLGICLDELYDDEKLVLGTPLDEQLLKAIDEKIKGVAKKVGLLSRLVHYTRGGLSFFPVDMPDDKSRNLPDNATAFAKEAFRDAVDNARSQTYPVDSSWSDFLNVFNERKDTRPYVSVEEAAIEQNLSLQKVWDAANFFHDVGELYFFQNLSGIADNAIIVDPESFCDAEKIVLDHCCEEATKLRKGGGQAEKEYIMDKEDLHRLWERFNYRNEQKEVYLEALLALSVLVRTGPDKYKRAQLKFEEGRDEAALDMVARDNEGSDREDKGNGKSNRVPRFLKFMIVVVCIILFVGFVLIVAHRFPVFGGGFGGRGGGGGGHIGGGGGGGSFSSGGRGGGGVIGPLVLVALGVLIAS